MIAWGILGVVGTVGFWLLLHFIKEATRLRTENEALKKQSDTKSQQLAAAVRPADSPSRIIDRMRNDQKR